MFSKLYEENTNYYDKHLRNMGTTHILCAADRLFCYWITSPYHGNGRTPVCKRFCFTRPICRLTHCYTCQKRIPSPNYESAYVSSNDTFDQMLDYIHDSKMVTNQCVSTYASSKGTV